jgi:hypothetical protein
VPSEDDVVQTQTQGVAHAISRIEENGFSSRALEVHRALDDAVNDGFAKWLDEHNVYVPWNTEGNNCGSQ